MAEKADAAHIRSYLQERKVRLLTEHPNIPRWWPNYAYHFTDIQNAAQIIGKARVYSRRRAVEQGLMTVENADTDVIRRSPELTETSARFYFRPKTPTQYHNEGVRPESNRSSHKAHCPVPVFFLFPLGDVLVRQGTLFTDTAAYWDEVNVWESLDELKKMNWADIYSAGSMQADRRNEITGFRRAEILVPEFLPLEGVHRIICRTPAERDTLLNLLDRGNRDTWRPRIEISEANLRNLYEARWVYLESVHWIDKGLLFKFNPCAVTLTLRVEITNYETGETIIEKEKPVDFYKNSSLTATIPGNIRRVQVKMTLDGCLAYAATLVRLDFLKGK